MQIVSALYIDDINIRSVEGPSTRIDLSGIQFSAIPPEGYPSVFSPHLVVILRNGLTDSPDAALEVTFHRDGEQIARNVQPVQVEPGKFAYRLVRVDLDVNEPGTIEAHCRLNLEDPIIVPFTLLPTPEG